MYVLINRLRPSYLWLMYTASLSAFVFVCSLLSLYLSLYILLVYLQFVAFRELLILQSS